MRNFSAVALVAVVIVALLHFWQEDRSAGQSTAAPSGPRDATSRDSRVAAAGQSATQPSATSSIAGDRTASGGTERPAATPVQVVVHAPPSARVGETFPVTIEVRAWQGIRQLSFSVVYKKEILELAESSPGALARPGGPSATFEEVSEGSLLVRLGFEGNVIAGAGTAAVVQFRAQKRGVSPLGINTVTYLVEGRQNESNDPVAYEGTITVE